MILMTKKQTNPEEKITLAKGVVGRKKLKQTCWLLKILKKSQGINLDESSRNMLDFVCSIVVQNFGFPPCIS